MAQKKGKSHFVEYSLGCGVCTQTLISDTQLQKIQSNPFCCGIYSETTISKFDILSTLQELQKQVTETIKDRQKTQSTNIDLNKIIELNDRVEI